MDLSTVAGLRDRFIIAVTTHTFARGDVALVPFVHVRGARDVGQ
ncbi:MAG: hypothetical protein ABSG03_30225 [Bryobacteraceae bacterium]|jgi:hypothetical protein